MDIQSVRNAFDRFAIVWEFEDFWTRANTFDACLRCYTVAAVKWPGDPNLGPMKKTVDALIEANTAYYDAEKDSPGYWADDFGWWGLASLTAYQFLLATDPSTAGKYLTIAKNGWEQMKTRGYDPDPNVGPVAHGCFNSPEVTEGVTKNTVTNLNLLLLSIRLTQTVPTTDPDRSKYVGMAYAQYLWFSTWFTNNYKGFTYLRAVPTDSKLGSFVQERPMAAPGYLSKDNPPWQEGWLWAGDQGLMLASLKGLTQIQTDLTRWGNSQMPRIQLPSNFEAELGNWFASIATGIRKLLVMTSDNVLHDGPFAKSVTSSKYAKDYVCGRGVLLRYMTELLSDLQSFKFKDVINATAAAAISNCSSEHQFGGNWTDAESDDTFNAQFIKLWGFGDPLVRWPFDSSVADLVVRGVLQGLGLDTLAAAVWQSRIGDE